jgi:O-antigen ligase
MYHAHNGYLDFFLQIGVVGLGLLVIVLVVALARAIGLALAVRSADTVWPCLTILALAVTNITESQFTVPIGWLMLSMSYFFAGRQPAPDTEYRPQ